MRPMDDEMYKQFLDWRGIEEPCPSCAGRGRHAYSSTATWRGGMGGASMTDDVCDKCWGSGDLHRKGDDLRAMRNSENERIAEAAVTLLAGTAGCSLLVMHPAIEELCGELDKLTRGRKERPPWFENCCIALAKTLRAGVARRVATERNSHAKKSESV